MKRRAYFIAVTGILAAILFTYGCTRRESSTEDALSFSTPDEAVAALVAALEKQDVQELKRVLGPGTDELVSSGDDVADRAAREAFLARYREQHRFVAGSPGDVVLQVAPMTGRCRSRSCASRDAGVSTARQAPKKS